MEHALRQQDLDAHYVETLRYNPREITLKR